MRRSRDVFGDAESGRAHRRQDLILAEQADRQPEIAGEKRPTMEGLLSERSPVLHQLLGGGGAFSVPVYEKSAFDAPPTVTSTGWVRAPKRSCQASSV